MNRGSSSGLRYYNSPTAHRASEHSTLTIIDLSEQPIVVVIVSKAILAFSTVVATALLATETPDALAKLAKNDAAAIGHEMSCVERRQTGHGTVIVVTGRSACQTYWKFELVDTGNGWLAIQPLKCSENCQL